MRYLIISDIHGSHTALRSVLKFFHEWQCDYIIVLGDILYHGPRNPLPAGHAPGEVAATLNELASHIIAVRGNCDCEVDQMVLHFPCMPTYVPIVDAGNVIFATHGHVYNPQNMPLLQGATLFLYGHTHLWDLRRNEQGVWLCNPGSVSLPKEGRPATFAMYDNGRVGVYTLDGRLLASCTLGVSIETVAATPHIEVEPVAHPLLQRAIRLATDAHMGQKDRAGHDYINHPLRVMHAAETLYQKIAAVLHDVVEDTSVTLDDLARQFPPVIIEALSCLTHTPDMSYEEYIRRIATNSIATHVKLCDLSDNMDVRRLAAIDDHDVERLRKYMRAYKFLTEKLQNHQ